MPSEKPEIRISLFHLLAGVALTIVPICLVGLYTTSKAEQAMERTVGGHFHTIAQLTATEVSSFINDRVVSVGTLAADPTVVATALAANRTYAGQSEAAIGARIESTEKAWTTPAAEPMVREMLTSNASRLLARWRDRDRRFLRITLTDGHGAVIAATHKTLDYFQADEDFWQGIYAQGRGAVHMTDVLYDDVTKSYYVGLGVPVMEEGSNTFVGALDALVEVSSIFPLIHRVSMGPTSRAILVKQDGTIILSPTINLAMNMKSEEFTAVQEAMGMEIQRLKGYTIPAMRGGERVLIGYADTGLKGSYANLNWTVLVVQDVREAFAATRGVLWMNLVAAGVGLAMVTLLGAYFSLHRRNVHPDIREEMEAAPPPSVESQVR